MHHLGATCHVSIYYTSRDTRAVTATVTSLQTSISWDFIGVQALLTKSLFSRQHFPYVLISGIPGRYGLRWAKLKVFLSLFTCNSYSPCFRMTRSGYFSTRMGSWFRSRNSSEFWYQLLSIFDISPHAKRWTRISEEQGRIELKSVSTTAFARLQSCFFDSHAHCLMMLRLTLMTRCANFRLGFKTKIASRNHYHLYTPFPYNSLFL